MAPCTAVFDQKQFTPSTPLSLAQDFNDDGRKDLAYWRENGFVLTDGSPIPDAIDKLALIMSSGLENPAF